MAPLAITTIACVAQSLIYPIYVEFSIGVSGDKSGRNAGKRLQCLKCFDVEEICHVQEIVHGKVRITKQAQRITRKKFNLCIDLYDFLVIFFFVFCML